MNPATNEGGKLLAAIRDEWVGFGQCTEPADRKKAQWAVRSTLESAGCETHSMLFFWVPSPMAGVLASTSVGFALRDPMKQRMMKPLNDVLGRNVPAAKKLRREVDDAVWRARNAVHAQLAAELDARGPEWENWKRDIGDYTWDQVWQTIGDPLYSQGWEQRARESGGLFEENLKPWADAMMEGQFSAGAMAQLDAMSTVAGLDVAQFDGIRRLASNCSWWWAYELGAVLCERPARFEVSGKHVTIEFRDGWTVQT